MQNLQEFANKVWEMRHARKSTIATATRRRSSNKPSLLIAIRWRNQAYFYWYVDEGQCHVRDRFSQKRGCNNSRNDDNIHDRWRQILLDVKLTRVNWHNVALKFQKKIIRQRHIYRRNKHPVVDDCIVF